MTTKVYDALGTVSLSLIVMVTPLTAIAGGSGDHHHNDAEGHHSHDVWVKEPEAYTAKRTGDWSAANRAVRGKALYETHCLSCHGADGRGTGPVAKGLSHPPADLTNHFHYGPGQGDAYLFWRVSEGGAVEPFKSQQSAMPPFKTLLSEEQRWDVLIYVHQSFHGGFKATTMDPKHGEHSNHKH